MKQLFLILSPGVHVRTQNLGNIVGTWSALWSLTVCVLFLRLCYFGITFFDNRKTILAGNANAFLKNQINNMGSKIQFCT